MNLYLKDPLYSTLLHRASVFRYAIEQLKPKEFADFTWFSHFPKGCCAETNDLLALFFYEINIFTDYVWGVNGQVSHAWLEYNEYIIDITADQFEGICQRVIVTKDKSWYLDFQDQRRYQLHYMNVYDYNTAKLRRLYRNILRNIERFE